jgi:hypothetical protein
MKKYTGKRRGDQTGFALPRTSVLPIFFIKSSLIRMIFCKSCELATKFHYNPTQFHLLYGYTQNGDEIRITGPN